MFITNTTQIQRVNSAETRYTHKKKTAKNDFIKKLSSRCETIALTGVTIFFGHYVDSDYIIVGPHVIVHEDGPEEENEGGVLDLRGIQLHQLIHRHLPVLTLLPRNLLQQYTS